MSPRATLILAIVIGLGSGACGGGRSAIRRESLETTLFRWVPPNANALGWVDLEGFRRSSLHELVDNDLEGVQALLDEVSTASGAAGEAEVMMPPLLNAWHKLDGVLLATEVHPPAADASGSSLLGPAAAPPPTTTPEDDSVMVFLARWTAADIEAIARARRQAAAATPAPPQQPAVIQPQPEPPAPPGLGGPQVFGGPGTGGPDGSEEVPPSLTPPAPPPPPPPEPIVPVQIAGKAGWKWGDSALVPVGGGVWLLGNVAALERILQHPPSEAAREHPELSTMARAVGLFDLTMGYVGREDTFSQAESLVPSTGLTERAPWPKIIEQGDWFGVGMTAESDVTLQIVVQPAVAARVDATETRMRAWRERVAQSGISRLMFVHEAFENAHVQAGHDRVGLEAVIEHDRAALAYARISGIGITVGIVVYVFVAALSSSLSALGSLGS